MANPNIYSLVTGHTWVLAQQSGSGALVLKHKYVLPFLDKFCVGEICAESTGYFGVPETIRVKKL